LFVKLACLRLKAIAYLVHEDSLLKRPFMLNTLLKKLQYKTKLSSANKINMNQRFFLVLLLTLSSYPILLHKGFAGNHSYVYKPDKEVMLLAQDFDKTCFPLFLKMLEAIRNNDTSILTDFFYIHPGIADFDKSTISLKNYKPGVPLIYTRRFTRSEDYLVSFPINWSDDIHPDKSWRLWFQSLRWLQPYLRTNNEDSIIAAFNVIDDWNVSHTNYPASNTSYAYDDHASAERLLTMVMAYHKLKSSSLHDPSFQNRLMLSILAHIFFISSLEKYHSWHNHAIIFDERLLTSLRNLHDFKLRAEFASLAFQRVFEQYRNSFTNEGVHKEHSPCYHIDFTNSLNWIISLAEEFNYDVPPHILTIQKKANEYSCLITMGNKRLTIGDCAYESPIVLQSDNYAYEPLTIEYSISKTCSFEFNMLPASGWVFVFDTLLDIHVVIQSDFYSFAHYQQDDTSFILNIREYEMIIDPGLHSYNTGELDHYYRSARAHNLLIVDENNFDVDFQNNTGRSGITRYYKGIMNKNSEVAFIEMTHPHYEYMGIEVFRQFFFPGSYNMIIKDIAYAKDIHNYSQLFHLAPDAIVIKNKDSYLVSWPHHPYQLRFSSNEDGYSIIKGQYDPLMGWYFPGLNQTSETPVLILNKTGSDIEFITRIELLTPYKCRSKKRAISRNMKNLSHLVDTLERRSLVHQPTPNRWQPDR